MTSIGGFAEAIRDGAIEDSAHAADVIIAESRRLERLVGDLLDLSKLEAHQLSITLRATDAAEVLTTTAEGFRPAAAKRGLTIVVQAPAEGHGPTVTADPDRLAQLLANLLENAMTFARTTVTVGLAPQATADECVMTVEDDGPGIAQGDLTRVFERFYRPTAVPTARSARASGWPSWPSWRRPWAAPSVPESPGAAGRGSRFVVTLPPWREAPPA